MDCIRPAKLLQFLFFVLLWCVPPAQAEDRVVALADGVEVPVQVFPAEGSVVLLWLPSEMGFVPGESDAAAALARKGVEVWMADTLFARFLPVLASSLDMVPPEDVGQLIAAASKISGKRVYLVTAGRGAVPALRGALAWQEHWRRHSGSGRLAGAILLYPNLYEATPEPGEEARYLPVATRTNLPIVILQGQLSPWYWYLDTTKSMLEQGGSRVYVTVLPGTRDRFYGRDPGNVPLPAERAMAKRLPDLLEGALQVLTKAEEN